MKCLILAAGYATRLYPLTENFPKPLLKVGDKTILDRLLEDIDTSGAVDEYVVISNHKFAHHFEKWAKNKPYRITVVDDGTETNETRLGAVRDIRFAIESLGIDEDMLVIAGDNVLDFSLTKFISYCKEKKTSCVMRYYELSEQKLLKCGVLTVGEDETREPPGVLGLPGRGVRRAEPQILRVPWTASSSISKSHSSRQTSQTVSAAKPAGRPFRASQACQAARNSGRFR